MFVGTPPGEANAKTTFSDLKFRADQVSIWVPPGEHICVPGEMFYPLGGVIRVPF